MISSRLHHTNTRDLLGPTEASAGPTDASIGIRLLAESLVREFSAPVGIYDPYRRDWKIILGVAQEWFPRLDGRLQELASSSGLRLGRVAVWRRERIPTGSGWCFPCPQRKQPTSLRSWASVRRHFLVMSLLDPLIMLRPRVKVSDTWGPACPEPPSRPGASSLSTGCKATTRPVCSRCSRPTTRKRASTWSSAG